MMLGLGFGVDAHGGDHGVTPLHAAAYAGSADAVRLLLDRGADVEARDENWDSHPLVWAAIGSSEQPDLNPHPDWAGPSGRCSRPALTPPTSASRPTKTTAQPRCRRPAGAGDDYRSLSIGLSLMSSSSCSRWLARLVVAIRTAKWRTPAVTYSPRRA